MPASVHERFISRHVWIYALMYKGGDCVLLVLFRWKFTVFPKCKAKHAARSEVFDAAGLRKRL